MSTILERLAAALADRYDVSKEIGAGGMATVYLGHDLKHERDVAIKVLHPDLGAALGSERFLSEIKTTAKLQHPHILPLLDSGEADSLLYYVMPFVVGESLRARIDRERQLPIGDAVRITKEVASALDYAHRHGVIHRDIKPDNILLHDGQALVADFGIALAVTVAGGGRMTQTGLSLGTPQYMSPEQAVGERTIDARSDIYSLAAVTYEMITGEPPFAGNSVQAVVSKIMTEKPTQMMRIRDTVPETVENAVNIALAKLPADRFTTAAEFSTALTTHVSGFSPVSVLTRGPGDRSSAILRQRLAIPLAGLSLLLLLAALWGWMRPEARRQVSKFVLALDSTETLFGPVGRIALSPDGSTLVFTGGKRELYARPLNDLHAVLLPGTNDVTGPTFSPDGQQIAFSTPTYQLKVVSLQGGLPTLITDSIVGRSGLTWSSDGYIYTVNRSANAIVRLRPAPGSPVEIVTALDTASGETAHRLPDALPDGKGFLFTVYYGSKGRTGTAIAVQRPGSRTHSILLAGLQGRYSPSGHLVYATSTGTLMAIRFDIGKLSISGDPIPIAEGVHVGSIGTIDLAISRNGTLAYTLGAANSNRELIWVSRDGHAQQVDSTWRQYFQDPSLSPDGKHLALTIGASAPFDIWVKQLDNGPSQKLTFAGTQSENPTWTPDGQSVTYSSNADNSGVASLWTKRADGSAPPVSFMRQKNASIVEAVWSRDAKWVVVRTSTTATGSGDIFASRPGADTALTPIATSKFIEKAPDLSPDGKFLVFSSNETGRDEIYVVPFPAAATAKWAISTAGGTEPRWSHSGSEIFFRDGGGNMVSVPVKTSAAFSFGAPKTLFPAGDMVAGSSHRQYDISADDQRFLMLRFERSRVPDKLVIVNNWFDELKNKSKK